MPYTIVKAEHAIWITDIKLKWTLQSIIIIIIIIIILLSFKLNFRIVWLWNKKEFQGFFHAEWKCGSLCLENIFLKLL